MNACEIDFIKSTSVFYYPTLICKKAEKRKTMKEVVSRNDSLYSYNVIVLDGEIIKNMTIFTNEEIMEKLK